MPNDLEPLTDGETTPNCGRRDLELCRGVLSTPDPATLYQDWRDLCYHMFRLHVDLVKSPGERQSRGPTPEMAPIRQDNFTIGELANRWRIARPTKFQPRFPAGVATDHHQEAPGDGRRMRGDGK